MAQSDGYEAELLDIIVKHFNPEELKALCFKLNIIPYEDLGGEGKEAKTIELICYAKRNQLILDLEREIIRERPNLTSKIRILTRKNLLALIDLYGIRSSNRFSLILDLLEHNIHQALKVRKPRSITDDKDIKFFASIKDYWRAYEADELKEGTWVEIEGTFSEYGPLLSGAPWAKKEDHFNWRTYVSDVEAALGIDGIVSVSSGNALIHLNKVEVQSPFNGEISSNKYAGLYQYIGRNSIPIVIDEHLLLRAQKEVNMDSEILKMPAYNVRIRGTIEEPSGLYSTVTTLPERFDKKQYVLQVAGDDAFIKIIGSIDFFESDIWVVVESKAVENMVVRCPDLSEQEAMGRAIHEIKEQLKDNFGPNYDVKTQFDRVSTPFGLEYREDRKAYLAQDHSKLINLVRQLYKLGK
jgi:Effector-associated domain 7